ncbi:hypothetical protein BLOT_014547 [Blomia tropicalis]|nr:hypothetical protein BLOT_014547 [Blomia tropicalis]
MQITKTKAKDVCATVFMEMEMEPMFPPSNTKPRHLVLIHTIKNLKISANKAKQLTLLEYVHQNRQYLYEYINVQIYIKNEVTMELNSDKHQQMAKESDPKNGEKEISIFLLILRKVQKLNMWYTTDNMMTKNFSLP